jgi:hypothetical protein
MYQVRVIEELSLVSKCKMRNDKKKKKEQLCNRAQEWMRFGIPVK